MSFLKGARKPDFGTQAAADIADASGIDVARALGQGSNYGPRHTLTSKVPKIPAFISKQRV